MTLVLGCLFGLTQSARADVEWYGLRTRPLYFDVDYGGGGGGTNDYRADFNPGFSQYVANDVPLSATNWSVSWVDNPHSGTITVVGPSGPYGLEYIFNVNRPGKLVVQCDVTYLHFEGTTSQTITQTVACNCYAFGGPIDLLYVAARTQPPNSDNSPATFGRLREGGVGAFEPQPIILPLYTEIDEPRQTQPLAIWKVRYTQPAGTAVTWQGSGHLTVEPTSNGLQATATPTHPGAWVSYVRSSTKPGATFAFNGYSGTDATAAAIKAGTIHMPSSLEVNETSEVITEPGYKGKIYELELLSRLGDPLDDTYVMERITEVKFLYDGVEFGSVTDPTQIAAMFAVQQAPLKTGMATAANKPYFSYNAKFIDVCRVKCPLDSTETKAFAAASGEENFDIDKFSIVAMQTIDVATTSGGEGGMHVAYYKITFTYVNGGANVQVTRTVV